jgi:hypothetical protein
MLEDKIGDTKVLSNIRRFQPNQLDRKGSYEDLLYCRAVPLCRDIYLNR